MRIRAAVVAALVAALLGAGASPAFADSGKPKKVKKHCKSCETTQVEWGVGGENPLTGTLP